MLNKIISEASKKNQFISLFVIDIDNYKAVNDNLGHLEGDKALASIGKIFKDEITEKCISCRFGGDEFVILHNNMDYEKSIKFATKLRNEVRKAGSQNNITASIGIACLKLNNNLSESSDLILQELLKKADIAMYQAKKLGKDQFIHYDDK